MSSRPSKSVRLGAVSVEARIEVEGGFVPEEKAASAKVFRASLDGAARPGTGAYRLIRLVQPERSAAPSDIPVPRSPAAFLVQGDSEETETGDFDTPGDRLRPRWEADVRPEVLMREWKDGEEISRGRLDHGARGDAVAQFGRLAEGASPLGYYVREGQHSMTADDWTVFMNFADSQWRK